MPTPVNVDTVSKSRTDGSEDRHNQLETNDSLLRSPLGILLRWHGRQTHADPTDAGKPASMLQISSALS